MATILNRQVTFSTNGTVTAAGLHNLIDETEIYAGIITTQPVIASVGSSDQLLIADADLTPTSAPRRVTVGSMFNDALNNGVYTSSSFTGTLTAGSFVGPLNGNVTGTIVGTGGTISSLTTGTTTSTAANITNGTVQTLTASTASISQGSAILTQGTIATLNSTAATITTGTIPTLVATTLVTTGTGTAAVPAIVPTGDTNTGIFFPAADTIAFSEGGAEAMRIDSNGNVTVGGASIDTLRYLDVSNTNSSANAGSILRLITRNVADSANTSADIVKYKNGQFGINNADTNAAAFTSFNVGATERLRIDSSGNVGIGTTSPARQLSVSGGTATIGITSTAAGGNTIAIDPATTANSNTAQIDCSGANALRFNTNSTERLRIDSSGVFYVNETSTNTVSQSIISGGTANALECETSSSASYPFLAINTATSGSNRFVYFGTEAGGSSQRGFIDYNRGSNVTRYSTTSDARLKNIIGDSSGEESISILKNTKIRDYTWKEDESAKVNVGVIAQELHNVFKGAVSVGNQITRKDSNGNDVIDEEPWGVDKTAFTFHLISGWQSHEKIIQELKLENNSLKARLEALEAK